MFPCLLVKQGMYSISYTQSVSFVDGTSGSVTGMMVHLDLAPSTLQHDRSFLITDEYSPVQLLSLLCYLQLLSFLFYSACQPDGYSAYHKHLNDQSLRRKEYRPRSLMLYTPAALELALR